MVDLKRDVLELLPIEYKNNILALNYTDELFFKLPRLVDKPRIVGFVQDKETKTFLLPEATVFIYNIDTIAEELNSGKTEILFGLINPKYLKEESLIDDFQQIIPTLKSNKQLNKNIIKNIKEKNQQVWNFKDDPDYDLQEKGYLFSTVYLNYLLTSKYEDDLISLMLEGRLPFDEELLYTEIANLKRTKDTIAAINILHLTYDL